MSTEEQKKDRIEFYLEKEETQKLDAIAHAQNRSRKNYLENIVKNLIKEHEGK